LLRRNCFASIKKYPAIDLPTIPRHALQRVSMVRSSARGERRDKETDRQTETDRDRQTDREIRVGDGPLNGLSAITTGFS
jgi:hypothetical protein